MDQNQVGAAAVDVKVEALEYLRSKRVAERETAVREIIRIDVELSLLRVPRGVVTVDLRNTVRRPSPLAMSIEIVRELNRPMTTREIVDTLIVRGVTTTATSFGASVFATLRNSKAFTRQDGKWELAAGQPTP